MGINEVIMLIKQEQEDLAFLSPELPFTDEESNQAYRIGYKRACENLIIMLKATLVRQEQNKRENGCPIGVDDCNECSYYFECGRDING